MALPGRMTATQLFKEGQYAIAAFVALYGGDADDGIPAPNPIGKVSVRSIFVCGSEDAYIRCNKPYALSSRLRCVPLVR